MLVFRTECSASVMLLLQNFDTCGGYLEHGGWIMGRKANYEDSTLSDESISPVKTQLYPSVPWWVEFVCCHQKNQIPCVENILSRSRPIGSLTWI